MKACPTLPIACLAERRFAMTPLSVVILHNAPVLPADHPDAASEAGVLDAVEAVEQALTLRGHAVERLPVGESSARLIEDLSTLRCDAVFNLCEGLGGTGAGEAAVAGLLELCGVAYTGCSAETLSLVRDKARTKWLLAGGGLPTAPFCRVLADEPLPRAALAALLEAGPCIVKPAREDASLGISADSVVTNLPALERQATEVRARYGDVLIEQFIDGREFNVGVVMLPEPRLLPIAEIEFAENAGRWKLVTYNAKWAEDSDECLGTPPRCPADVSPELAADLGRVALAATRMTGCRDYARVDVRVNERGEPFVLEVNPNPDISPGAGFPRALAAAGIEYDEFVCRLVEQAQRRSVPPIAIGGLARHE